MNPYENICQTIGETPLIRLRRIGAHLSVNLYAKVEFFNPGASIKDRIALQMLDEAEQSGRLRPGATIIEATAGNTGTGLALIAAVRGYRCLFVVPDKMSAEKVALLQAYGAEVITVPSDVPPDSPHNYNQVADRLTREIPGAFRPAQFENPENPQAHYLTTGPEIARALQNRVDVFVAGAGTGGTISGVGRYLKERCAGVRVILADPHGSILSGDSPRPFAVEGIGEDFFPPTYDPEVVDGYVRVSDAQSFQMARRLAREEGILAGGSSGTALAAALHIARDLPPGANIVIMCPDTGRNYLSKIFNDQWMQDQGFLPRQEIPDK